jgi:hypothetical protein
LFEGSIENGKKNGKGFYKKVDGTTYNGFFKNDKFHGSGVLKSLDGSTYKGDFIDGL